MGLDVWVQMFMGRFMGAFCIAEDCVHCISLGWCLRQFGHWAVGVVGLSFGVCMCMFGHVCDGSCLHNV